jgi:hypothetical protein
MLWLLAPCVFLEVRRRRERRRGQQRDQQRDDLVGHGGRH